MRAAEGLGLGEGELLGVTLGLKLIEADGLAEGVMLGVGLIEADSDREGLTLGLAEGDGEGEGERLPAFSPSSAKSCLQERLST